MVQFSDRPPSPGSPAAIAKAMDAAISMTRLTLTEFRDSLYVIDGKLTVTYNPRTIKYLDSNISAEILLKAVAEKAEIQITQGDISAKGSKVRDHLEVGGDITPEQAKEKLRAECERIWNLNPDEFSSFLRATAMLTPRQDRPLT